MPRPAVVIHAHPLTSSFNAVIYRTAVASLGCAGASVNSYRLDDGDEPDLDRITEAEILVFAHPTWWGGPPALLLDWIQRTLGPFIDGDRPEASSPLAGIEDLVTVTTHGSGPLTNGALREPGRRLMRKAVLPLCASDARFHWLAHYGVDHDTEAQRANFLDRVDHELSHLARQTTRPSTNPPLRSDSPRKKGGQKRARRRRTRS